jgi:transposase
MVFDAHERAFAFFKGTCRRGLYNNMKTAVETVFVGKDRAYNRRFLQMCGHFLVEPTACTPAAGWEKGQVENQVGLVRERFFTPRLRFKSYEGMNGWLLDRSIAYAKAHRHPPRRRHRRQAFALLRCFGRGQTIYDPWHYVPVLARKPDALRNGAPFKDWVLPGALARAPQIRRGRRR